MMLALRAHRVDSRPFFPPMHLQPVYNTGQHLPVTEAASARGLCLPSHPALARADVDRIADLVRAAAAGRLDGAWRAAA
jgi:perosamine synthetase